MDIKQNITDALHKILKKDIVLEVPPDSALGDYAFPCFNLAKEMRKAPPLIAQDLIKKLGKIEGVSQIKATGPYLNFFVNKTDIVEETINTIRKQKDKYGASIKKEKIIIEHTSINPNASPHVGRARNALIGDSIVRLMRFNGADVDVRYFVNDVGKQIAMLVLGSKGKKNVQFDDLLKIYVDINEKSENNSKIEKEVFELLNNLEKGDAATKKKFKDIVDICIKGQSKIFKELEIEYDKFDYESKFLWDKKTEEILSKLKKTGKLFEDEENRLVLNQEGYNIPVKNPVLVLTRADKTSLYPLRDIAYTIEKMESAKKNIIILGEDQKTYFQQIKAALDLLGYKAPVPVHYSFVLLAEGKMSTRKGNVVLLEDFMKEAVKKAKEKMKKKNDKIAKTIAYGAVKYAILKVSNEKNVMFDLDSALSFEGDTGPYLQYSYARICSIFDKYGKKVPLTADLSLLKDNSEIELVKELARFPDIVKQAANELSPYIIANYVFAVAKRFSEFYHACPILTEKEELKKARLILIDAVRQVLANGLDLLGLKVVEEM
ncbi:arginine--tRNA ligase [Candidatus Woesearchaeota archaeon]|nr:arginine--tRNA ligase [Candidatus Woesearchaeota archaeon]